MIVDTSAVISILKGEPGYESLRDAMLAAESPQMSAASLVEAGIVVDRLRDPAMSRRLDQILDAFDVQVVPVTAEHALVARRAYQDYGTGSGHTAGLNFGDVFAYALVR